MLGVGLRAHRDVFTGRHRHGAGHQAGHPRDQHVARRGGGGGDAHDQARRRDDAVVGAQHRRAQPADALDEVVLGMQAKPVIAPVHRCPVTISTTTMIRMMPMTPTPPWP